MIQLSANTKRYIPTKSNNYLKIIEIFKNLTQINYYKYNKQNNYKVKIELFKKKNTIFYDCIIFYKPNLINNFIYKIIAVYNPDCERILYKEKLFIPRYSNYYIYKTIFNSVDKIKQVNFYQPKRVFKYIYKIEFFKRDNIEQIEYYQPKIENNFIIKKEILREGRYKEISYYKSNKNIITISLLK